ncbi:MAG: hypothetical protein EOM20_07135 [Spartobacteria bacterium]|nr:hypothetical protein [Spartobacteria bacterium]
MASIHRREGTKNWQAAYYLPDGTRTQRTTGTSDRAEAMRIALKFEDASRLAREKRLTVKRTRKVITDLFEIANGDKFPNDPVSDYLNDWLTSKELTLSESSLLEYRRIVKRFLQHLGDKAEHRTDDISSIDAQSFYDDYRKRVTINTANKAMKILSAAWTRAVNQQIAASQIFKQVDLDAADDSHERDAFTPDELNRVLVAAGNTEWRGIILFGYYTGQRLSDIALIKWSGVDLLKKSIEFKPQKTGDKNTIPLHNVLFEYLMDRASTDARTYVFPEAAARHAKGGVSVLSKDFKNILVRAGIIAPKKTTRKGTISHQSQKKGRDARRTQSERSFHCLRHLATSDLKNSGATDAQTKAYIGHKSQRISDGYTHISFESKKEAGDRLPDITKGTP